MRINIDINHPGHVHFFKHFYTEMTGRGHEVLVTASKKDVALDLLRLYNIPFINIGSYGKSIISKLFKLILLDIKMLIQSLRFKPDVIVGIGTIRGAHAAFLTRRTSLIFTDTEHAKEQIVLYKHFCTKVVTPNSYFEEFGSKHIKYNGYHELAYLHKNRFVPNPDTLSEFGLQKNSKFYILRFIGWDATHDLGKKGLTLEDKWKLVRMLSSRGRVLVSYENTAPKKFHKYIIKISPHKIHDLLYFAQMYVGEGGTMASEAAVLGTPSVFISPLTAGTFLELENKYGLMVSCRKPDQAPRVVSRLLDNRKLKEEWREKAATLMHDKIDVTDWMVNYVENLANMRSLR